MNLDAFRLAARSLRKQPAYAIAVVLSLALGIAVNTTMYGVLDALIKPRVDMRDPSRLYWIKFYGDYKFRVDNRGRDAALATGLHTYESLTRAELTFGDRLIEHGQNVHEGSIAGVGPNYFDVLGVRPLLGRTFIPSDESAETTPVVIDENLAGHLFPTGESPIGARITINREPRVVIGVISRAARFPDEHYSAWSIAPLNARSMYMRLIRLRDGASPQDADRELRVVANRIAAAAGEDPKAVAFRFHQAADPDFQFKPIHFRLIAAVVAVLLVACANLANIQLARGIGRRRELALRSALGATRRGIVAHLITESTLLAMIGLLLGLVLTFWGSRLLHASIPPSVGKYIVEPQISWRVLAFALGATVFCLILIGLAPAISVSRTDPNELLKSGAGTGATKRNRHRYAILVGAEIALALALSSLAAANVRMAMRVNAMGYGYDPRPLATGFGLPIAARGTILKYSDVLQSLAARVAAVNGVSDAATSTLIARTGNAITVDDPSGVREFPAPLYSTQTVSPSYVRVMGWPIVQGRDFLDGQRDQGAVIVDEQTAKLLWPNSNPIGALIKFGDKHSLLPYARVVGVIGERPQFSTERAFGPSTQTIQSLGRILYLPGPADTFVYSTFAARMQFVARATDHPGQLPITLRREARGWSDLYMSGISTMDDYLGITRGRQETRFVGSLFTLFAALGIGLAAFGVFGVVAHSVAERRRELGVRVALGASPRNILEAVLRESVVVALAGAATGLFLTWIGVSVLGFGETEAYNAPLFAGVAAFTIAVTAASAFVPALRATRIDPTESLRAE